MMATLLRRHARVSAQAVAGGDGYRPARRVVTVGQLVAAVEHVVEPRGQRPGRRQRQLGPYARQQVTAVADRSTADDADVLPRAGLQQIEPELGASEPARAGERETLLGAAYQLGIGITGRQVARILQARCRVDR